MRPGRLEVGICLGLVVLTAVAFGDLLWGAEYEFVNFDDYHYVRDNPQVQAGLTRGSVWWALTTYYALNWHPLTWVSLQLDRQVYGLHPWGFHLTNLLLHTANAVLLFLALRWMSGAAWPAAAVAALFAVHPLHVESVAWVTERKDVLSTFFWMLTLLGYTLYAEHPSVGRYLFVVVCLALGLMSKPMLVTLPCVLLLLDFWPLGRWSKKGSDPLAWKGSDPFFDRPLGRWSGWQQDGPRFATTSVRWLLLEKVPLLLLVAGSCVLTVRAQSVLIENAQNTVSFRARLLNALVSYVAYLRQTFWPSDLAVLYPHPLENVSLAQGVAAGLLLVGVTLAVLYWRSRPYLLVGWLWYLGTLVPVIGILQVGPQARADRYTYVPLIGIFLALAFGAADLLGRLRHGRVVFISVTTALLAACTVGTWSQLQFWHNSTTLWDRALQVSGDDPNLHLHVTLRHLRQGETDEAIKRAQVLCQLQPDNWESHRFLALALTRKGKLDEAAQSLTRALALQPDSVVMNNQMAELLWSQGRIPAAYQYYAIVARLQPDSAEGQYYRGTVLQREGKFAEAIRCFEEAIRLAPSRVLYHCDLALALEDKGDWFGAVSRYRLASELYPEWPQECGRLAWILATHPEASYRDGKEAIRRAREACWITDYKHPAFLETLAAAYAEAGLFERATSTAETARKLAIEAREAKLADRIEAALRGYRNEQPFRDSELK